MRKLYFISLGIIGFFLPLAGASAGIILSTNKYAWSNNAGYINFEGVIVEDNGLSGHAWSTNTGFINFSPAQGGVTNDGTGNLSGSAWGEGLGWIDFDNVSINETGQFTGTASGEVAGTITFDCPNFCDVRTDWQASSTPPYPYPTPSEPPPSSSGGGSSSSGRRPQGQFAPGFGTSAGVGAAGTGVSFGNFGDTLFPDTGPNISSSGRASLSSELAQATTYPPDTPGIVESPIPIEPPIEELEDETKRPVGIIALSLLGIIIIIVLLLFAWRRFRNT